MAALKHNQKVFGKKKKNKEKENATQNKLCLYFEIFHLLTKAIYGDFCITLRNKI
jgi:hypothetical protein